MIFANPFDDCDEGDQASPEIRVYITLFAVNTLVALLSYIICFFFDHLS